jgi:hypothetical protein
MLVNVVDQTYVRLDGWGKDQVVVILIMNNYK